VDAIFDVHAANLEDRGGCFRRIIVRRGQNPSRNFEKAPTLAVRRCGEAMECRILVRGNRGKMLRF
jgi:hypothetical protein